MNTPTEPTCFMGPLSALVRVNCVPLIIPVKPIGEVSGVYPESDINCLLV